MTELYHTHYNDRVIREGKREDSQIGEYVNQKLKKTVTAALESCLRVRPAEPLLFLAEEISKGNERNEETTHRSEKDDNGPRSDNFELMFSGGLLCTVKKIEKVGPSKLPLEKSAPFHQLICPSSYTIEETLRVLESSKKPSASGHYAPTLILVEPPSAPEELVSIKGIPYVHNLVDALQYHRRRGTASDDTSFGAKSLSTRALEMLKDSLGENLETLDCMMKPFVSSAEEDTVAGRKMIIFPSSQGNYLEEFKMLDEFVREAMSPYLMPVTSASLAGVNSSKENSKSCGVLSKCQFLIDESPTVLFISYNKERSAIMWTRIITTLYPYFEYLQLEKIAENRANQLKFIHQHTMTYYLDYWKEVHRRREERDESRGSRRGIVTRRKGGIGNSNGNTAAKVSASAEGGPVSPTTTKHLAETRESRRQNEDSAFLEILKQLRAEAATKIQAVYRGYCVRKTQPSKSNKDFFAEKDPIELPEFPSCIPAFLRKCLEHLMACHGEIFANYPTTLPPQPRRVRVYRPVRGKIKDDNADSETDEWEHEDVCVCSSRQSLPPPHVNLYTRLVELHQFCECSLIDDAIKIQRQCSGFSLLQRRSYELIKSAALNLFYAAYTELYHRGMLSKLEAPDFVSYFQTFHSEVSGWFNFPHLTSKGFLVKSCRRSSIDRNLNAQLTYPTSLFDDCFGHLEYILCNVSSTKRSYLMPPQVIPTKIGSKVYVVPSVLSSPDFKEVLKQLTTEAIEEKSSETPPKSNALPNKCVSWWTLCPYPLIYVGGQPLVLLPRQNRQIVDGLPGFDEFVLRREQLSNSKSEKAAIISSDKRQQQEEKGAPKQTVKVGEQKNDEGFSSSAGVVDGVEASIALSRRQSERVINVDGSSDVATKQQNKDVEKGGVEWNFDVFLPDEDIILKKRVIRELKESENIHCYIPSDLDDLVDGEKAQSLSFFRAAERLEKEPITMKDMENRFETKQVVDALRSISLNQSLEIGDVSATLSISKSGRRRSVEREGWQKVLERAASRNASQLIAPSFPDSLTESPIPAGGGLEGSSSSRRRSQPTVTSLFTGTSVPWSEVVQTLDEFVRSSLKELEGTEIELDHKRPFFFPSSSSQFFKQMEYFMEKCLSQIKKGNTIVIAGDQPEYALYAVISVILSQSVEEANHDEIHGAAPRARSGSKNAKPVESILETMSERLNFFKPFYQALAVSFAQVGINVPECVEQLHDTMKSVGNTVLKDMELLIEKAECEPNRGACRRLIIEITCLAEQYCLLVLAQILVCVPFTREVFKRGSDNPLTSFSSFVTNIPGVVQFMDSLNPWMFWPERDPDAFKLRYSSRFRRWDNNDYICFGTP